MAENENNLELEDENVFDNNIIVNEPANDSFFGPINTAIENNNYDLSGLAAGNININFSPSYDKSILPKKQTKVEARIAKRQTPDFKLSAIAFDFEMDMLFKNNKEEILQGHDSIQELVMANDGNVNVAMNKFKEMAVQLMYNQDSDPTGGRGVIESPDAPGEGTPVSQRKETTVAGRMVASKNSLNKGGKTRVLDDRDLMELMEGKFNVYLDREISFKKRKARAEQYKRVVEGANNSEDLEGLLSDYYQKQVNLDLATMSKYDKGLAKINARYRNAIEKGLLNSPGTNAASLTMNVDRRDGRGMQSESLLEYYQSEITEYKKNNDKPAGLTMFIDHATGELVNKVDYYNNEYHAIEQRLKVLKEDPKNSRVKKEIKKLEERKALVFSKKFYAENPNFKDLTPQTLKDVPLFIDQQISDLRAVHGGNLQQRLESLYQNSVLQLGSLEERMNQEITFQKTGRYGQYSFTTTVGEYTSGKDKYGNNITGGTSIPGGFVEHTLESQGSVVDGKYQKTNQVWPDGFTKDSWIKLRETLADDKKRYHTEHEAIKRLYLNNEGILGEERSSTSDFVKNAVDSIDDYYRDRKDLKKIDIIREIPAVYSAIQAEMDPEETEYLEMFQDGIADLGYSAKFLIDLYGAGKVLKAGKYLVGAGGGQILNFGARKYKSVKNLQKYLRAKNSLYANSVAASYIAPITTEAFKFGAATKLGTGKWEMESFLLGGSFGGISRAMGGMSKNLFNKRPLSKKLFDWTIVTPIAFNVSANGSELFGAAYKELLGHDDFVRFVEDKYSSFDKVIKDLATESIFAMSLGLRKTGMGIIDHAKNNAPRLYFKKQQLFTDILDKVNEAKVETGPSEFGGLFSEQTAKGLEAWYVKKYGARKGQELFKKEYTDKSEMYLDFSTRYTEALRWKALDFKVNPEKAIKTIRNDNKQLVLDAKEYGIDLKINVTDAAGMAKLKGGEFKDGAHYDPVTNTLTYNANQYAIANGGSVLQYHEAGHVLKYARYGTDFRYKKKFLRNLENILAEVPLNTRSIKNPKEQMSMLEYINTKMEFNTKDAKTIEKLKEHEIFTYIAENYHLIANKNGYKLKNWIIRSSDAAFGRKQKYDLHKEADVRRWFADYVRTNENGGSVVELFKWMDRVVDLPKGDVINQAVSNYSKIVKSEWAREDVNLAWIKENGDVDATKLTSEVQRLFLQATSKGGIGREKFFKNLVDPARHPSTVHPLVGNKLGPYLDVVINSYNKSLVARGYEDFVIDMSPSSRGDKNYDSLYNTIKTQMAYVSEKRGVKDTFRRYDPSKNADIMTFVVFEMGKKIHEIRQSIEGKEGDALRDAKRDVDFDVVPDDNILSGNDLGSQINKPTSGGIQFKNYKFKTNSVERTIDSEDLLSVENEYKNIFNTSTSLDTYFNTAKGLENQTKVITNKILGIIPEVHTTPKLQLAVAKPNFEANAEIFLRSFPNFSDGKFYENSQIGKSLLKVFYRNTGVKYKTTEVSADLARKTNARAYKYEKLEVTNELIQKLKDVVLSGPNAGAIMVKIQTAAKFAGDVMGVQTVRDMFDVTTKSGEAFESEIMQRNNQKETVNGVKSGDFVNPESVNKYLSMTTQLAIERLRGATPAGVKSTEMTEDNARVLIEKIKGIDFVNTPNIGVAMALIMENQGIDAKTQKKLLKETKNYDTSVEGIMQKIAESKRLLGELDAGEKTVVTVFNKKYKQINKDLFDILVEQGVPEVLAKSLLVSKSKKLKDQDFMDQYHGTKDVKDVFGNVIKKGKKGFVQEVLSTMPKEILVKYESMIRSSFTLNGIEKMLGSDKVISADEGKAIMEGVEGVETIVKKGEKNSLEYLDDVNMVNNSSLRKWHKKLMLNKKYENLDPSSKKGQKNLNDYVKEIRGYLKGKGSKSYKATVKANKKLQLEIVNSLYKYYKNSPNKAKAITNISFLLQGQTSNISGFGRSLATHIRFTTEKGEIYMEHAFALANWSGNTLLNIVNNAGNSKSFLKRQEILSDKYHQMAIPTRIQRLTDGKDLGGTTSYVEYAAKDFEAFDADVNYLLYKSQLSTMVDIASGKTLAQLSRGYQYPASVIKKLKFNILKNSSLSPTTVNSKSMESLMDMANKIDKAIDLGRRVNKKSRGISVFDFDETVGISENFVYAKKGSETKKISSAEWPFVGDKLLNEGWKMDFTDFNKVTKGKPGPLMQKLKNQITKFGVDNVFILTARAPESQKAIQDYLASEGVYLPSKNITGLGNSTGEAKAMWMLGKFSEGYNDMYFVDDALPNVKAVKNVLNQLDIKSKVQQAIIVKSTEMTDDFASFAFPGLKKGPISTAKGQLLGKKKYTKSFIVPGAQDFKGLLQNFIGKGPAGENHKMFFNEVFHDPYARAYNEINSASQTLTSDYSNLGKIFNGVVKKLNKEIPNSPFTYDQAIRVHRWTEAGFKIPGLDAADLKILNEVVLNDSKLLQFSDNLGQLSKQEMGYIKPTENWIGETIVSDLSNMINKNGRTKYFEVFRQNRESVFGVWENGKLVGPNMSKIEATQGPAFKDALEDMLWRMETGSNRPAGKNKLVNMHMNFINGSVGATMFLNTRSAALQTLSTLNYINWSDNNPLAAGKAFGNQKQYWSDFHMIFTSDMLKQRRSGLKYNVQEAELAQAAAGSKNKASAVFAKLLKIGFAPTQIADSFAISAGGASFYRNRIKTYEKQGMSGKKAQEQAWLDFQETTEVSQQSSRPDLISQQQAGPMGRMIFAWGNTPMQYARIQEKAVRDLINGRGSKKENLSKLAYYGFVQATAFTAMQNAMFAFSLDSENSFDDSDRSKRVLRGLNSMLDTQLRGIGIPGAIVSTVKNTVMEYQKQSEKGYNADHTRTMMQLLSYSPVLGSKFRKIFGYSGIGQERYNADANSLIGFSIDNPRLLTGANVVEATTNLPAARVVNKIRNLRIASDFNYQWWQNAAAFGGWSGYDLGIDNQVLENKKSIIKFNKKNFKVPKPKKPKTP